MSRDDDVEWKMRELMQNNAECTSMMESKMKQVLSTLEWKNLVKQNWIDDEDNKNDKEQKESDLHDFWVKGR